MNKNNTLIVYKLAWAKCALMALSGAIIAWTTSMSGVQWENLGGTEKINVILGCVGAAIVVVIAFLDRTISRIEGEREEIPGTPESIAAGKSLPDMAHAGNLTDGQQTTN